MNENNPIKGIIFDLDGTLINSALNFNQIRQDLDIYDPGLLEHLKEYPEPEKTRKYEILERHETQSAYNSKLYDGASELLDYLRTHNIKVGVVTRNSRKSWHIYQKKHKLSVDAAITRDDAEIKPSPAPFQLASTLLNIPLQNLLSVGDYKYEIIGSKQAGIRTVLILHDHNHDHPQEVFELSDFVVHDLYELKNLIEKLR